MLNFAENNPITAIYAMKHFYSTLGAVLLAGSISLCSYAMPMNTAVESHAVASRADETKSYDGYLSISMMGAPIANNQAATVQITPTGENTCTFLLPDLTLEGLGSLGDIKVDEVLTSPADNGTAYAGDVKGMQLLDGAITADVTIAGTITADGKVDMVINVVWVMDEETSIPITVTFSTEKQGAYKGYLNVNMMGMAIVANQEAEIEIVPEGEGTCTFMLPNLTLGDLGSIGDIVVNGVTETVADDGTKAYTGEVKGMQLLEGAITADVKVNGTITADGKVDMVIDVIWVMDEENTIPIAVTFSSEKQGAYKGYLNVSMAGQALTENQESEIEIIPMGEGLCTFKLPNLTLGDLGTIGDIVVENVAETTADDGTKTYTGEVKGMQLLEGAITADVTLNGTISADGKVNMVIDVVWESIPIAVTFTTDPVSSYPVKEFPGYLNVEMAGNPLTVNQEATLQIIQTSETACTFLLPDLTLGDLGSLGDIKVENVAIHHGDYGTTYEGEQKGMQLMDGAITADVKLMASEGRTGNVIDVLIEVMWNDTPITVTFSTTMTDGVISIDTDQNAPVEYYNLQGVRVANPEGGIFIRRQGNKTTKIAL